MTKYSTVVARHLVVDKEGPTVAVLPFLQHNGQGPYNTYEFEDNEGVAPPHVDVLWRLGRSMETIRRSLA